MKKLKKLLLTLTALGVLAGATACDMSALGDINIGGVNLGDLLGGSTSTESTSSEEELSSENAPEQSTPDSEQPEESTPDSEEPEEEIPEFDPETLAIVEAAYALGTGETLEGTHTLQGTITNVKEYDSAKYTICLTFNVAGKDFYCYWMRDNANGDNKNLAVGDTITVTGTIKNYNGTVEFDKPTLGEVLKGEGGETPDTPAVPDIPADSYITIAEALELCGEPGNVTEGRYYIRGIIESVLNPQYGEMQIKDETGSIYVYGTYNVDGSIGYANFESKPVKGDEVLLHCILQNHNGTKEVKNARLIEFTSNAGNFDESNYTAMTIEEARIADVGAMVKVEGVVAQITYANGMKPSGVYLVDNTNSIYVYDNDIAGQVSVGNKITVLASKTYWVLEKEQSAASKHGYKGCNQLEEAYLVANDKGTNEFDKSWIEETTVKEIMDTPVTEDITTTIYKVNALVKTAPGNGFVNYYINDLDETTGSYVYTQCNGGDFEWVDAFNGKICTVYLSVINAKSSDTGCIYRFLPISIQDDGYTFDLEDAAKFAVKYYGMDQFATLYEADPAKEMVTEVSSALLEFSGAQLSYESDNEAVAYFTTENGVTTFHCGENGTAKVTVTATYGNITYSESIEITVVEPVVYESITVAEAIAADVDSEVTVKGIVGPSVVNKNGFYLFGEDGSMIAVLVDSTDYFVGLEIGHEVVLKGMRERYVKAENEATRFGQTCIVDAEILVNYYGNHTYSTAKFVEGTTGQEFYALDKMVDYSTTVFIITGTVEVVETAYYTNLNFIANGQKITLYCSSANQYSWLKAFAGQEVTLEIAACNWNDKTFWAGCALAAYTADGKILNTLNFDNY
ncbi:MAG: hypothetical protein IKA57_02240 [Clostridia bacterium]|nr:hypothetical protein [Clostridia bacterium]